MIEFLNSSIDSCEKMIEHYDFVIKDILSEIPDSFLEANKGTSIDFLNAMKKLWERFKKQTETNLREIEKRIEAAKDEATDS